MFTTNKFPSFILCGLIVAISCLLPTATRSETVQAAIGDQTLALPLPEGHCALTRDNPSDRRLIELVENGTGKKNEVVLAFADCQQLDAWHTGKQQYLDDFGQYQTLVAAKDQNLGANAAALIKQVCDAQRNNGEGLFDDVVGKVNEELEKRQEAMSVNEMKFLGIYSETSRQCSGSFIQKVTTESGTSKTLFGINTTAILRGKVVYLNIYTRYEGEDSFAKVQTKHAGALETLLAGN